MSWIRKWGATIALVVVLLLCSISVAEAQTELSKEQVKQCTYISGIASVVQSIRQETGHTFERFVLEVDNMYQQDEGLTIVKGIAFQVYNRVGKHVDPDDVFGSLYSHCAKKFNEENNEEFF